METEPSSHETRISQVLEEIRVVMPGSQALLGFQLVALFSTGFTDLSQTIKELHLASLLSIALATIFLMAPSAYHRIACGGKPSRQVHRFAGAMLVTAMFFLILGLSIDIGVATFLVLGSVRYAWMVAGTGFAVANLLWFLYPALARAD